MPQPTLCRSRHAPTRRGQWPSDRRARTGACSGRSGHERATVAGSSRPASRSTLAERRSRSIERCWRRPSRRCAPRRHIHLGLAWRSVYKHGVERRHLRRRARVRAALRSPTPPPLPRARAYGYALLRRTRHRDGDDGGGSARRSQAEWPLDDGPTCVFGLPARLVSGRRARTRRLFEEPASVVQVAKRPCERGLRRCWFLGFLGGVQGTGKRPTAT